MRRSRSLATSPPTIQRRLKRTRKQLLVSHKIASIRTNQSRTLPGRHMSEQKEIIRFYSVNDAYGEFSNFAPYPIRLDSKTWPTSEHYFQAQKFEDAAHREAIRKEPSPMKAAQMGRSRKNPLRRDWESVKVAIMRNAVLAKFTRRENLRSLLLSTGDAKLIEHTTNDSYWADGGDGSGKNMLGQILMEVRKQLWPCLVLWRAQWGSSDDEFITHCLDDRAAASPAPADRRCGGGSCNTSIRAVSRGESIEGAGAVCE